MKMKVVATGIRAPEPTMAEVMEAASISAITHGKVMLVMWQEEDGKVNYRAWPPASAVAHGLLGAWCAQFAKENQHE